jgi:hypothetical protein
MKLLSCNRLSLPTMYHVLNKISFQDACVRGDIATLNKYLLRGYSSWYHITESFEQACLNGQLEVAKCLEQADIMSHDDVCNVFPKVCMTPHINVSLWLRSILSKPLRISDLLEMSSIMVSRHMSLTQWTSVVLCLHNHLPAIYHPTAYHYRFILMQITPDEITDARATYYIETEYALQP